MKPWMKRVLAALAVLVPLNVHVVRVEDEVVVLAKDQMSLRDTFVDATDWGVSDYIDASPRVRNHLLAHGQYPRKLREFRNSLADLKEKTKNLLRPLESAIHGWLSDQLE